MVLRCRVPILAAWLSAELIQVTNSVWVTDDCTMEAYPGWVMIKFSSSATRNQAQSLCTSEYNGDLASITSSTAMDNFETMSEDCFDPGLYIWIGAYEYAPNNGIFNCNYEWTDGETWTDWGIPWGSTYPQLCQTQRCVPVRNNDYKWITWSCGAAGGGFAMCNDGRTNPPTDSPTPNPTDGTASPTRSTSAPTMSTPEPTRGTASPTANTAFPTRVTAMPTESTSFPTSMTSFPTKVTSSPTLGTSSPTLSTSMPTRMTSMPTLLTSAPTLGTISPTLSTAQPTSLTGVPTNEPTQHPTNHPTLATSAPTASPTGFPTRVPTMQPSMNPTSDPTADPSANPSQFPSKAPSMHPSENPSNNPTRIPSMSPTMPPTNNPTRMPSTQPSQHPSVPPTEYPSSSPSIPPTPLPSASPSTNPTRNPTFTNNPSLSPTQATSMPSESPSVPPTEVPSRSPTRYPSGYPTISPITSEPSMQPSMDPTEEPTQGPSQSPSSNPSQYPSKNPSQHPTGLPTSVPSEIPTRFPSVNPTEYPTWNPSDNPTSDPSSVPSQFPSANPTANPTRYPTSNPTMNPSYTPSVFPSSNPTGNPTTNPSRSPSVNPSQYPSMNPTSFPSRGPSKSPSKYPSHAPSEMPSDLPSQQPSDHPSNEPSHHPSHSPSNHPSGHPTYNPSKSPTQEPSAQPTNQPTEAPNSQSGDADGNDEDDQGDGNEEEDGNDQLRSGNGSNLNLTYILVGSGVIACLGVCCGTVCWCRARSSAKENRVKTAELARIMSLSSVDRNTLDTGFPTGETSNDVFLDDGEIDLEDPEEVTEAVQFADELAKSVPLDEIIHEEVTVDGPVLPGLSRVTPGERADHALVAVAVSEYHSRTAGQSAAEPIQEDDTPDVPFVLADEPSEQANPVRRDRAASDSDPEIEAMYETVEPVKSPGGPTPEHNRQLTTGLTVEGPTGEAHKAGAQPPRIGAAFSSDEEEIGVDSDLPQAPKLDPRFTAGEMGEDDELSDEEAGIDGIYAAAETTEIEGGDQLSDLLMSLKIKASTVEEKRQAKVLDMAVELDESRMQVEFDKLTAMRLGRDKLLELLLDKADTVVRTRSSKALEIPADI